MTRTGLFTNSAIAAVLVVPAITLQGGAPGGLDASLESTLVALEALTGIGREVENGRREAVGALIASTEPALPDAQRRDELLNGLRSEVSALERELDGLHGPDGDPSGTSVLPRDPLSTPSVAPTRGMDEATRRLLSQPTILRPVAPAPSSTSGNNPVQARPDPTNKKSFEAPGYAADALALARAYYRKGEWVEALALLEGRDGTPAETYWRARCLEKLERNTEAVAAYELVLALPDGGWEAQRAREDLDFLRWRMKFSRVGERKQRGSDQR